MPYKSCAAIGAPGWEATPGQFCLNMNGCLRFVRVVRRVGSNKCYIIDEETPRASDKRIAAAHRPREAA